MNPGATTPVPAHARRGALRRPRRALLRRPAARACTRCSSAARARAAAARRASSAKAGAGATPRPAPRASALAGRLGRARRRRRRPRRDAVIGNRPEFVFVLLALQRLGAIAVPVGVREQRPGLAYIAAPVRRDGDRLRRRARRARARCRRGAGAARCALRGVEPGCGLDALTAAAAPRRSRDARDRRRRDPLHLGHDRPAQGRDAHPPGDRPLGAALRGLHAAGAPTTARRWRCRRATSPG